ncbi:2-(1,2-epoxy-1,2-dihydrophenyl)acetyl-CoA isomerase PaaG [Pseudonocardia ailaonensis]|uniref:2-(1,2-epoxy-1,2-dihydrophenyl)acetyl-CoA isomerase PaaG n=1 Tax=Pseudonocardia ailaonensis TaxID=367279 RepID=A0ABN2NMS1_9PSEU
MTDDPEEPVLTDVADGVLTVTINRPDRKNAANAEVWTGLREAFRAADHDREVRTVVVQGAGGDFCAGADLSGGLLGEHPLPGMRMINEAAFALHDLSVPTVAKVRGVAVGAGWNLALGCDLVIAERDARFSQIFARRGLSLDFGGSWLLPRLVGMQQAKRLALLAEIIGAEEAERLGLVTTVVEPGTIDAHVAELTKTLAAGAPVAMAQTKALLHENAGRSFREALESEARAQSVNFAGSDAPAAFEAFLEKRDPEFTGGWNVG